MGGVEQIFLKRRQRASGGMETIAAVFPDDQTDGVLFDFEQIGVRHLSSQCLSMRLCRRTVTGKSARNGIDAGASPAFCKHGFVLVNGERLAPARPGALRSPQGIDAGG